jgi:choline dehydrogenase-like flavoprotein
LCSDQSHPRGLGNDHDVVGRYFMEHAFIDVPFGRWKPPKEWFFYSERQQVGAASVWGQIVLSEGLVRRERLPGLSFWFQRASPLALGRALAGRGRDLMLGRERLQDARAEMQNAGIDLAETITDTGRQMVGWLRLHLQGAGCGLRVNLEQVPDPQNRVRLVSQCDRFGQRRVEIDFRLTDVARHARSMKIAAHELGLGARRIVERMLLRIRAGRVGFFWHHLGTTRMHRDPAQGVVDADCRVHGVRNLFVAGSSVFPTGGTAPPTLTIVALAVRLADHVRRHHL